ncbi:MAG: heavy metal-binding domain-containing protein [Armatimonadota bacterium]|nr:heavy metal-binding domain-containing protein [Armatimonadota bacterium]
MDLKRLVSLYLLICCVGFLISCAPALAGNDIYFVTYNHHIEKGEMELMIMTDLTEPAERTGEVGSYLSSMLELEYGVTEQYATELMLEGFFDFTHGFGKFTGFRWENRYRLHKEKNRGLNPVLYMEYEDLDPETRFKMEVSGREDGKGEPAELEGKRERILETRLILSRDKGPYNYAFNWINETDTRRRGFTEFGYAIGMRRTLTDHHHEMSEGHRHTENAEGLPESGGMFRCSMHQDETSPTPAKCPDCGMDMVADQPAGRHGLPPGSPTRSSRWKPAAIGIEMYGGLGNNHAFSGPFKVQQHYIQPIIMFHPRENMMIHLGAAIGLTPVSDDLIRVGVGFEF